MINIHSNTTASIRNRFTDNNSDTSSPLQHDEDKNHHKASNHTKYDWGEIREKALSALKNTTHHNSKKNTKNNTSKRSKRKEIFKKNQSDSDKGLLFEQDENINHQPARQEQITGSIKESAKPDDENKQTQPALRQFSGKDGFFYFLTSQGKLHRYDPSVDEVINTGLNNISQFTMGADGKPYALIHNRLVQLDQLGNIKNVCSNIINTEDNNIDLAITPLSDKALILTQSGEVYVQNLQNPKEMTQKIALPKETSLSMPHSISIDAKGHVWLLGQNDQVWTANLNDKNIQHNDAIWVPVTKAPHNLLSLEILPDGRIGGRTIHGELLTFDQDKIGSQPNWKNIPFQTLTQSLFHQITENMHRPDPLELTSFLGGISTAREFPKDSIFSPIGSFKNIIKSIPRLYQDLKNFDYKKKQHSSINLFHEQVNKDIRTLHTPSLSPSFRSTPLASLLSKSELGTSIDNDSIELLNIIEKDSKKSNSTNKKHKNTNKIKKTANNILTLIKETRTILYGKEDDITKKLDHMQDKGLYLEQDTSPYQGVIAKLISDHATLLKAAQELSTTPDNQQELSTTPDNQQELSTTLDNQANKIFHHHLQQRNESIPNLLLRSGISNSDPFGKASQGFDAMQAIFREQADLLNRITNQYLPIIDGAPAHETNTNTTAELFSRLLHSMKPEDSISLGKSADTGFNTEALRLVFSGYWASLGAGNLNSWLIPIVDVGKLKDVNLSLTKVENGIKIQINRSRDKYLQLGLRTGIGATEQPEASANSSGFAWGFGGWEIAFKNKHSQGKTDTIELTLKDQGNGNLQKTITDIMTGKADLFDLMRQSDEIASAKTKNKQHSISIGNVGILAGGLSVPGWIDNSVEENKISSLLPLGKALGALLPEVNVEFGSKNEVTETTNNKGEKTKNTTQQKFGLQSINANVSAINALESEYLNHLIPGNVLFGSNIANPEGAGRAGVASLLPGVVLGKTFSLLSPTTKTVSMTSSSNDMPDNIHVDLLISRSSQLAKNISKYEDLKKVPGLKNAIDTLTHQQGKKKLNRNQPVNLKLELKPDLLKQLPTDKKERKNTLLLLAKDLDNFRISELSVENEHQDYKSKGLPIPALTRTVNAYMATSSQLAHVSCIYDQDSTEKHALKTLHKMASFPESSWGNSNAQRRVTQLKQELDNLINALGETSSNWKNGQDLQRYYQKEFKGIKDNFDKKLHTAMLNKFSKPQQEIVEKALNVLRTDIKILREKCHLPPFEGPSIVTSGPLFNQPYTGKMKPEGNLKPFKEVPIRDVIEKIKTLSKLDLSSLKGKKLEKEKKSVIKSIDEIKKRLGTASDIDSDAKDRFLANLFLLPARPSTQDQLSSLLHELDQLAPRD